MNLRCKPSDLAIVTTANCRENLGRFVTVVRAASWEEVDAARSSPNVYTPKFFWWLTDSILKFTDGGSSKYCPDNFLTPIRGDLTDDEMRREMAEDRRTDICETAVISHSVWGKLIVKGFT